MEEERTDALEVGPQAYAAEDAQNGAEESIEDHQFPIVTGWSARCMGDYLLADNIY